MHAAINKEINFDPFAVDMKTLKKIFAKAEDVFGGDEEFRSAIATLAHVICDCFKSSANEKDMQD